MPYAWKTAATPSSPIDGQIHIDPGMRIYQYEAATTTWLLRPEFYLKVIDQSEMNSCSKATTSQIENLFRDKSVYINWFMQHAFNKSFIEAEILDTFGSLISVEYIAHCTMSEFQTWFRATVPSGGGTFTANVQLKIHDVFNPALGTGKIRCLNAMYGAARGRNNYYGTSLMPVEGKFTSGGGHYSGYENALTQTALSMCFGVAASTNNDGALWFANNRRSLYHFPKLGSEVIPNYERLAYDTATDTYVLVGAANRWIVGDPIMLYVEGESAVRHMEYCPIALNNTEPFTHARNGILIFPLTYSTYRAFLLKPYGVSQLYVDMFDASSHDLWAENSFKDVYKHRFSKPETTNAGNLLMTSFIHNSLNPPSLGVQCGLDATCIPEYIRYFLRNKNTGVRGEYMPGKVRIVRRRRHMPIGYLMDRDVSNA